MGVAHRALAAVGLADPVEQARQRARRVEVVGQRVEEGVAQRRQVLGGVAVGHPPARLPDALDGRRGRVEALARVGDRLPVVAGHEVHEQRVAPDLVEDVAQPADVALGLRHLLVAELQHPVVHPQPRERAPAGGQGLRGLVLVVGEQEIDPAAVDVELDAQQLLGHRRALDVPAGAPQPPR